MSDNPSDQPKQKTPKGLEIPVPTRKQVEDDMAKVLKAKPSAPKRRPKK